MYNYLANLEAFHKSKGVNFLILLIMYILGVSDLANNVGDFPLISYTLLCLSLSFSNSLGIKQILFIPCFNLFEFFNFFILFGFKSKIFNHQVFFLNSL